MARDIHIFLRREKPPRIFQTSRPSTQNKKQHTKTKKQQEKQKNDPVTEKAKTLWCWCFFCHGVVCFLVFRVFFVFLFFWFWPDGPGWAPEGPQEALGDPGFTNTGQKAQEGPGAAGRPGCQPKTKKHKNQKKTQGKTKKRPRDRKIKKNGF